jgi:hypothetical protein
MTGNKIQTLEMVWIRMGEDEIVDSPNLFGPQKWSDDVLTDVESIVFLTSTIDQHSLSPREFNQYRIAMAHINEREHEILLKSILDVPVDPIENESKGDTDEKSADGPPSSQMNRQEEEKIKKNDLDRRRR